MLIKACLHTRKELELHSEKRKTRQMKIDHKMNNDLENMNKKFIFSVSSGTRY